MRVTTTAMVSVFDDLYGLTDDTSKDFGTSITNEACTVYAADRFTAPSSGAPVSLTFGNISPANVVGWWVECMSAATLLVNGGATVSGGYTLSLTPAAVGQPATIMVSSPVSSLSIIASSSATVTGRYIVWGTVSAS